MKKTFHLLLLSLLLSNFSFAQSIQLVKNIGDIPDPTFNGNVTQMIKFGDRVLFFANDGADIDMELWQTDGAADGTSMVEDNCGSPLSNFANLNDTLFWLGAHNSGDSISHSLWKIGAEGNPQKVKTFNSNLQKTTLEIANGKLYWLIGKDRMDNGLGTYGIWQSDGTAANTLLKFRGVDFYDCIFKDIKAIEDTLFFAIQWDTANLSTPFTTHLEIHKFAEGSVNLDHQIIEKGQGNSNSNCSWRNVQLYNLENKLGYIIEGNSYCNYQSELGFEKEIIAVKHHPPSSSFGILSPQVFNGKIYFYTYQNGLTNEYDVEFFDGLNQFSLAKFNSRGSGNFLLDNGNLVFFSNANVWSSDGTVNGTQIIQDIGWKAYPSNFLKYNNQLIFTAIQNGKNAFWQTDGTADGTFKILDLSTHPQGDTNPFEVRETIALRDKILFVGNDRFHGMELWELDLDGVSSTQQIIDNQSFTINNIYPNPFSEQFTLEVISEKITPANLEVFNSLGQVIFRKEVNLREGVNTISIELKNEGYGMLTLKLGHGAQVRVMRLRE